MDARERMFKEINLRLQGQQVGIEVVKETARAIALDFGWEVVGDMGPVGIAFRAPTPTGSQLLPFMFSVEVDAVDVFMFS
jgi:hypothetical protein